MTWREYILQALKKRKCSDPTANLNRLGKPRGGALYQHRKPATSGLSFGRSIGNTGEKATTVSAELV